MAPPNRTPPNLAKTDWYSLSTSQRIRHLEIECYVVISDLLSSHQIEIVKEELDRLPTTLTDCSENQRDHPTVQWTDSPNAIDVIALPAMV